MSAAAGPPMTDRELLRWVYLQTREALFTKGNGKKASEQRDAALSRINARLAGYR